MFGIAMAVQACLRSGTQADVAWCLEPEKVGDFDPADAIALTPGGGRLGSLMGGAFDGYLVDRASVTSSPRVIEAPIGPLEASLLGLGPQRSESIRFMLTPADQLPDEIWQLLIERQPICLVSELSGTDVLRTIVVDDTTGVGDHVGLSEAIATAQGLLSTGSTRLQLDDEVVISSFFARPTMLIAGAGPMAEAIERASQLVGWNTVLTASPAQASGLAATLSAIDGVTVIGHDHEATGRVLEAALGGSVGYIGSVGPLAVQQARADWLSYRGVENLSRVMAPAGINIGARSPSEVAISVVAEMISHQSQTTT